MGDRSEETLLVSFGILHPDAFWVKSRLIQFCHIQLVWQTETLRKQIADRTVSSLVNEVTDTNRYMPEEKKISLGSTKL